MAATWFSPPRPISPSESPARSTSSAWPISYRFSKTRKAIVARPGNRCRARYSGTARRRRSRRARSRRPARHPRVRRLASARCAPRRVAVDDGVPRRCSREPQPDGAGDERAFARHGSHRARVAMQSRPPDLVSTLAPRSGPTVHARPVDVDPHACGLLGQFGRYAAPKGGVIRDLGRPCVANS